MATTKKIKLGTPVAYTATNGDVKLALVTATPETVTPNSAVPELSEGYLHLAVISPNGKQYARLSVPSAEAAAKIPDFAVDGDDLRGVWRLA